ncbi:MAG: MBL fold metallo-hydrolase, partial [Sphingomicrobium sp.]
AIESPVPVYGRAETLEALQRRFAYAFERSELYRPIVEARELGDEFALGGMTIRFVDQPHGSMTSLGLRFDESGRSVAYAIDFNDFTPEMADLYQGVDVLIADCLTRTPHPTHAHLDAVICWARDCGAGRLYLTHMGNGLDYRTLVTELPSWAAPAHDGLELAL